MIQLFHSTMKVKARIGELELTYFTVKVGVQQGDLLAPVLFNIFISNITPQIKKTVSLDDGVHIEYRLDGSPFNIRRPQPCTKTTTQHVVDLHYADDAAILAHSSIHATDSGCSHQHLPRLVLVYQ